jgi:hypothetical protein
MILPLAAAHVGIFSRVEYTLLVSTFKSFTLLSSSLGFLFSLQNQLPLHHISFESTIVESRIDAEDIAVSGSNSHSSPVYFAYCYHSKGFEKAE